MIPFEQVSIDAPRDSDAWFSRLLGYQFPGSWLPLGQEQVVRCAEPHFRLVSSVSGRLDYIETINQWNARIGAPSLRKTLLKLRLLPHWLTSAKFRLAFTSGVSANNDLLRARAAGPLSPRVRETAVDAAPGIRGGLPKRP